MKKLLFTLSLSLGILSGTFAQNAQTDIEITGKYRINSIIPLGKYRVWVELKNTSKYDYKDISYKIDFIAGDGTIEGNQTFVLHDYIGPGISKKLTEQYEVCPKDCKSIQLSIVSGTRLK